MECIDILASIVLDYFIVLESNFKFGIDLRRVVAILTITLLIPSSVLLKEKQLFFFFSEKAIL